MANESLPSVNSPGTTRVGWIGTGVMGLSMCQHLLRAGFSLSIFSRTRTKAETLEQAGAVWANSPAELASQCDIICSMVGFPHDVREIHLGPHGTVANLPPGTIVVDFTTSQPSLAVEIFHAAKARGIESVDAPVSGGDVGARNATLSIMLGGESETCSRLQPFWSVFGKTIVYQGPAGSGQHTKMVNQTLIASNMIGVCEALLYAWKAGLNLETVMQSVSSGAAGSWSLSNLGPRIIENRFDPGFFVEHFVKDMGIVLDEAKRMNLSLPGLALAHQMYVGLQAQGGSRMGTHALQLVLARLSNVDWPNRR